MPILFRLLLTPFLLLLFLSLGSFASLVLVSRTHEIARFASSGAPISDLFLFIACQLPHLLPLALPLSALLSALLLFRKLSFSFELTALRSCGVGLMSLLLPILILGAYLSLLNLYTVSELIPYCKQRTWELREGVAAENPLLLLQPNAPLKLKDAYVEVKSLKAGREAKELTAVFRPQGNERLALFTAKELRLADEGTLKGKSLSLITTAKTDHGGEFDTLLIENYQEVTTEPSSLLELLRGKASTGPQGDTEYLSLPRLIANVSPLLPFRHTHHELARRLSLTLAPLTLTLLGLAFGLHVGRDKQHRNLLKVTALAALFLCLFLAGKSMHRSPELSLLFYFLPHPLIVFFSLRQLRRTIEGIS